MSDEMDQMSERGDEFFDMENTGDKYPFAQYYLQGLDKPDQNQLDQQNQQIHFENPAKNPTSQSNLDKHQNSSQQQQNPPQKKLVSIAQELRDSTNIASTIVSLILKKADTLAYERYIDGVIDQFSVKRTIQFSEHLAKQEMLKPDLDYHESEQILTLEDHEPTKPWIETWIRSHGEVQQAKPEPIPEERRESNLDELFGDNTPISNQSPGRRSQFNTTSYSNFNLKKKEKKSLASIKIRPHSPVSMEQPLQIDEYEERYRKIKFDEIQRREQKEQSDKLQKQQQDKVKNEMKKELKSKFTFDFDGRVLQQKFVKMDKLPPSYHSMNFNQKESDRPRIRSGFENVNGPQQVENRNYQKPANTINNNQQQLGGQTQQKRNSSQPNIGFENQLNKMQPPTKLPYQEFNPKMGVTLYYNSQIKEGPKHQETINTLEDLENKLKLLQPKEPLQITRSEYQRITERGNLVANFKKLENNNVLKDLDQSGIQPMNNTQTSMNINNNQNNMFKTTTFGKIVEEDPNNSHTNRRSHTQTQFRKMQNLNNIKVNSTKLTRNLVVEDDDEKHFNAQLKQNSKPLKTQSNANISKKTPNDEFNLRMVTSPDWGKKQSTQGFLPNLPQTSKQNKKIMQQTLSTLYKLPRERDQGQGFKLTKVLNTGQSLDTNNNNNFDNEQQYSDAEELRLRKKLNPYNFRGTFHSTHSKFTDNLRSNY